MHNPKIYSGGLLGAAGFGLLAYVAAHAWHAHQLAGRDAVLLVVVLLLGMASVRLVGDGVADERGEERRASGHVEGARETVDRLAQALREDRVGGYPG